MRLPRILIASALGTAVVLLPLLAFGQSGDFGGEERTESLTYHGVRANALTRPEDHTRNQNPRVPGWGGCVPSSVRTAALHAGVPAADVERFWRIALERVGRGGTDPNLLAEMLKEGMPRETWTNYLDHDPETMRAALDRLSAEGHCIAGTMGWGELYGPGRRIAHFVNVDHFSSADDLACVEDNNDPAGVFRWMPSGEYLARCVEGGAWIFAFSRLPFVAQVVLVAVPLALAAALLILASSLLVARLAPPAEPSL